MDFEFNIDAMPKAPRLTTDVKVDDKGRLKLPPDAVEYLKLFGTEAVFVTSENGVTATIYPMPVWEHNEKVLASANVDPSYAEGIDFLTRLYGQESKIDAQNRVSMATNLRRELGLDGTVWLMCVTGKILVMNDSQMEARKVASRSQAGQALSALKTPTAAPEQKWV